MLVVTAALAWPWHAVAQIFTNVHAGLPNVFYQGRAAWGDCDNDGRLDLLINGATGAGDITQIWRNTTNGFKHVDADITGIVFGSVAWGDYDGDGRLDVALTGMTAGFPGTITEVWRNAPGGFVQVPTDMPGTYYGTVSWVDYDLDGRLDLFLTGYGPLTEMWKNTGSGFVKVPTPFPAIGYSAVAWGDYDQDGRPDVLLSGSSPTGELTQLWRNATNGFALVNILTGVSDGSVEWGDYDDDGKPDILLTGTLDWTGNHSITEVWRNQGNGFFSKMPFGLPGVSDGAAAWGDYDSDGRLDILLSGISATSEISQVWRNTGTRFTNSNIALPRAFSGTALWADYDRDGRSDILLTGCAGSNEYTQLFRNMYGVVPPPPPPNTPPSSPSDLLGFAGDGSIALFWKAAIDAESPASNLTYTLRLGSAPGAGDLLRTNLAHALSYFGVSRLPGGIYWWSVRATDGGFLDGPFAPDGLLSVSNATLVTGLETRADGTHRISSFGRGGIAYSVHATTNLLFPLEGWDRIGPAQEVGIGLFEFADESAMNFPRRIYRLQSP